MSAVAAQLVIDSIGGVLMVAHSSTLNTLVIVLLVTTRGCQLLLLCLWDVCSILCRGRAAGTPCMHRLHAQTACPDCCRSIDGETASLLLLLSLDLLTCFPPLFADGFEGVAGWPYELTAVVKLQALPGRLAGCEAAPCGTSSSTCHAQQTAGYMVGMHPPQLVLDAECVLYRWQ